MPTKKKPTPRRNVRTKNVRSSRLEQLFSNKKALIVILVVALVGIFFLFRTDAATTNFEAESGSISGGATTASDVNASNAKYAKFSTSPAAISTSYQRFPGDPNPKVTGKSYWGAGVYLPEYGYGRDPKPRHEDPTGKSLSVNRTYWGWNDVTNGNVVNQAKTDIGKNRLPAVSIKTPGWTAIASGQYDAQLDDFLRKLDTVGGPVWLIVHHEPDGGPGSGAGPKGEDEASGSTGWKNMQKKIRARMDTVGTKNIAFAASMTGWLFYPQSGKTVNDWWLDGDHPAGLWDIFMIDEYCDPVNKCGDGKLKIYETDGWKAFEAWAKNNDIPFGLTEWGDRGETSAAAADVQAAWNYTFSAKRDLVAWMWFDSNANSPSGGWELKGEPLKKFQQILRDDQRIMRIKDLQSGSTSTSGSYGTITANVNLPTSGTYKLWIRMNAPDTTNNAVQAQVNSGIALKIGDSSSYLTPNTWKWVDFKNGDVNNKTTLALSAGSQKVTLTGIEPGVKIDRVIITDETCTPQLLGDNCTVITTTPPPPTTSNELPIQIISPTNGATVSGTVTVTASPDTNVEEVSFRPKDVWAYTDTTAPFSWSWDTTKYPNGNTRFVIRARKVGDPGGVYTQREITVNIKNSTGTTTTPTPTDTIAPTKPTNLSANVIYDFTKLDLKTDLSWTAATDNVGVTKYIVSKNGVLIGETTTNKFTDPSKVENFKSYTYSVVAKDAAGLASPAATITATGNCWIFWCSTSVR